MDFQNMTFYMIIHFLSLGIADFKISISTNGLLYDSFTTMTELLLNITVTMDALAMT